MANWFVGPVMEKIIDAGFEYLKDNPVGWQTGMKEELQSLRDLHPKIKAVVFAASQQQIGDQNSAFNKWLWQLRDAIDEADDVLDEIEYLKHKEQLAGNKGKTKVLPTTSFLIKEQLAGNTEKTEVLPTTSILIKRAGKIVKLDLTIDPVLKKLEEVVHKLVNVSVVVSHFLRLFNIEKQKQQQQLELYKTRETEASPTNNFIGRRDEMAKIMQWLRNSSNKDKSHITSSTFYKNISLLSIVGRGGIGKTTLSQHVYNSEMTNEFDVKMWVCVSPNFNFKRVIAGMLESHTKSKCELDTLDALQGKLKYEVRAKKFLLVLDDIWEDDEEKDKSKWEKVFGPLALGSLGSKILVTTRADSVALMIAKVLSSKNHTILELEGLKDDECLELPKSQAFATVENPDAHKKSILEQIVNKDFGSPLVAKVSGGVFSDDMDEKQWRRDLDSIGSREYGQNIFFSLPKPLQSCFSFCSIFPQGHEFDKDDLIRMWIALNFIQPSSNPRETLEDIGERYFDILIKKSFFEKFQSSYDHTVYYYKMHDLLHELAQFVSARECYRVIGDEKLSNCETIRHLSVKTDDLEVLRKIKQFKKLRSLFLYCGGDNHEDFANVLSEIFKAQSSIRLLFIGARCQMPEAIGDLIHLRYLKCVVGNIITQLPRSICTLYHMNFIIYTCTPWAHFVQTDFLPRDMNNLSNLRYVELPWRNLPKMHWIGELHPLQKLNNFFVKNEAGYRINELEHMNELWELRIHQLENVKDAEEACSAKFCDKGSLTKLSLHWGNTKGHRNNGRSDLEEEVFDNLQPHNNLKRLTIKAYMGTRSARWMNNVNSISNLERIKLEGCLQWQVLPPFGQLRFLKSLCLRKMPRVKSIDYGFHRNDEDCAFPSLEVLHIEDLDALEDWFDAAAADDSLFPCLTELSLKSCPNLLVLPSLPPKLQKLNMVKIRWKGFSWLRDTSNCYRVYIRDCGDLPGIFSYGVQMVTTESGQFIKSVLSICDPSELLVEPLRRITSVTDLIICKNDKLVSFPIETEEWFLQVSSSLRTLKFQNLESLQSLPSFLESLSSLEELLLSNLKSLQHLSSLSSISSLKCLSLDEIPLLKSLPVLPSSLEELFIENLRSLECLPSSLSTISSLKLLKINNVPLLQQLPDLPSSLKSLFIAGCHEELRKRYNNISGFDRDKLAHIPSVNIYY